MVVGIARFDLRLAECGSLKDKRSVIRPLLAMLQKTYHCATAEVAFQDQWQRSAVGVSVLSETGFQVKKVLTQVERRVDAYPGVELLGSSVDLVTPEDL